MNMKRTIKPHKGGRSERIYARITKDAKAKLLARVKAEGYKSLGDWLEAQAMTKPNKACTRRAKVGRKNVSSNKKGSAKPARG